MNTKRECCIYGRSCYRKNENHKSQYSHPGDVDYTPTIVEDIDRPPCRFAEKCVRTNPIHFQEYFHPHRVQERELQESRRSNRLDADSNSTSTTDIQQSPPRSTVVVQQESPSPTTISVLPTISISQSDNEESDDAVDSSESYNITLINNLEPGDVPTIRARCVIKSDKHPCGVNGSGLMLTANLVDYSGEIRLVAFGPSVHYLFDSLEVDEVFDFTDFVVKRCDAKQGVGQINRLELMCSSGSRVQRVVGSVSTIPYLTFNFQPLETVDSMSKNEMVDIIAICESYGSVEDTPLKHNIMGKKRELNLIDQTKKMMLTIWGTNAEKFHKICEPGSVIAFKRARISDYSGRSLDCSCLSSATFKANPNILEAQTLRRWFETTMTKKTKEINFA